MHDNQVQFLIDEKVFFCDPDFSAANQFTIQSIPKNYTVVFESDHTPFVHINQLLNENKKNLLLIDKNIMQLYKPQFAIDERKIFLAEALESCKTLETVMSVLDFLQKNQFTKSETLIVVGGGIIQEVAALAAAMYKRGIVWMHFPTTLLSMCDSCIGGKASVNYRGIKNQLGLFSTPTKIYIYPAFLKTLSDEAIVSGLGEILKSCIIGGEYFLNCYRRSVINGKVKSWDDYVLLIKAALSVKKSVVEADEFESNHRRAMNYGHTVGHAIESLSQYAISHGQAIVLGMMLENVLSCQRGLLGQQELKKLNQLCLDLMTKKCFQ